MLQHKKRPELETATAAHETAPSARTDQRSAPGFQAMGYDAQVAAMSPLQCDNGGGSALGGPQAAGNDAHSIAAQGMSGSGGALPYQDKIQAAFGRFDVGGISAHTDGHAASATEGLGAKGYAHNGAVALAPGADLHTVAHEAAHVFQQRGGVQLKGGVGQSGDVHEAHADAVADAVVGGRSAEPLLASYGQSGASETVQGGALQRKATDKDSAKEKPPKAASKKKKGGNTFKKFLRARDIFMAAVQRRADPGNPRHVDLLSDRAIDLSNAAENWGGWSNRQLHAAAFDCTKAIKAFFKFRREAKEHGLDKYQIRTLYRANKYIVAARKELRAAKQ